LHNFSFPSKHKAARPKTQTYSESSKSCFCTNFVTYRVQLIDCTKTVSYF
jgi:hypothetical protein